MSKRQQQKENTRKKVMETAYQVYSEQGFSATTAAIAKAAQIAHGTIFVHFPSLDELLCCLIQEFCDALGLEIHRLAETSGNIEELLKAHVDALTIHESFYIRLIAERSLLPADAQMSLANIQSAIAYHFSKVIEREEENTAFKKIPKHLMFNTWMGLIHYYLLNKDFFSPDKPLLRRYGAELTANFLEFIKQ